MEGCRRCWADGRGRCCWHCGTRSGARLPGAATWWVNVGSHYRRIIEERLRPAGIRVSRGMGSPPIEGVAEPLVRPAILPV
jgi:hypothetical protein